MLGLSAAHLGHLLAIPPGAVCGVCSAAAPSTAPHGRGELQLPAGGRGRPYLSPAASAAARAKPRFQRSDGRLGRAISNYWPAQHGTCAHPGTALPFPFPQLRAPKLARKMQPTLISLHEKQIKQQK